MPTQSTLSQRLNRVQERVTTNAGNRRLQDISLDEMDNFVVMFGERHRNRRFIEVWESDQNWINFVVKRYESSEKPAHKELMHYINLKVERAELSQTPLPPRNSWDDQDLINNERNGARSKAMARPSTGPPDLTEEHLESTWSDADVVSVPQPQLASMEHRLIHLEDAMTRICNHLDQNNSYTGPGNPNARAGP